MNSKKKKKMPVGRPPKKDSEKKYGCNFTVDYKTMQRVRKLKVDKSLFINKILASIPDRLLENFNRNPARFLDREIKISSK